MYRYVATSFLCACCVWLKANEAVRTSLQSQCSNHGIVTQLVFIAERENKSKRPLVHIRAYSTVEVACDPPYTLHIKSYPHFKHFEWLSAVAKFGLRAELLSLCPRSLILFACRKTTLTLAEQKSQHLCACCIWLKANISSENQ